MNILNVQLNDIILLAIIGILVVFIALALLVFAFKLLSNISTRSFKLKHKKETGNETTDLKSIETISGQEVAAMAMALHLFLSDEHDEESNIITIKRIERRYSPWNSKIYGLTNLIR